MYQSPLRISGLAYDFSYGKPSRSDLLLARKKIEAEFELSGSDIITVEGNLLNRQEVITLFDELQHEQKLAIHLAIYRDPALLHFLETGDLADGACWKKDEYYKDSSFLFIVSPFYAQAVDVLYRSVLSGRQPATMLNTLAANPSLMLGGDSERAFRTASRYFLDKKNSLMHFGKTAETALGGIQPVDNVKQLISPTELAVLNRMPDAYEELRYDIASTLNGLCVVYDRRNAPKQAFAAIQLAANIDLRDGELRTLIPSNLAVIRDKQPGFFKRRKTANGKPSWLSYVLIGVFVVRILAAIFSSSSSSSSNSIASLQRFENSNRHSADATPATEDYANNMSSLLAGFANGGHTEIGSDTNYFKMLILGKPEKNRPVAAALTDAMFGKGLESGIVQDSKAAYRHRLHLYNSSVWEAIGFYSFDNTTVKSIFIPPHTDAVLHYPATGMRLDVTAGRHWDSNAYACILRPVSDLEYRGQYIKGWYTELPDNLKDWIRTGNHSLFETGPNFTDSNASSLVITDRGKGITVQQNSDVEPAKAALP